MDNKTSNSYKLQPLEVIKESLCLYKNNYKVLYPPLWREKPEGSGSVILNAVKNLLGIDIGSFASQDPSLRSG